jgi:hypothetical protein
MNAAKTESRRCVDTETFQHGSPELEDSLDDLFGSFPDEDLLSVEQCDHRVGRLLDKLNQVGIDREQL